MYCFACIVFALNLLSASQSWMGQTDYSEQSLLLFLLQGSSCLEDVYRGKQQSPYFFITSPPCQAFMIVHVDKSVVCKCKVKVVALLLMSTFFVLNSTFNILCYTPGCHKVRRLR